MFIYKMATATEIPTYLERLKSIKDLDELVGAISEQGEVI